MQTEILIDADKIDTFSRLMTEKLDHGDVDSKKAYIRAVVSAIEVDDTAIRIIGSKRLFGNCCGFGIGVIHGWDVDR